MTTNELKSQLVKQSGTKKNDKLSVRRWVMWLKDSKDERVSNLGFALDFGVKTDRLPNWTRLEGEKVLTIKGEVVTAHRFLEMVAQAALNQKELTTASGVSALQSVFGLTVK